METSSHIIWHAIDKHERKIIYNYEKFKEKGPRILFGHFLSFDFPLKWFLVGPPNHTFTF
jgi:hypothetical protein